MRSYFITTILVLTIFSAFAQKDEKLIEVAAFGNNQPIGVTVARASNRLFVSFPHKEPFMYGLTEIIDGKRVPFPDTDWNRYVPDTPETHFVNVQDLYADDRNNLWVLDSAPGGGAAISGDGKIKQGQFKLIQISLDDNKVKRIYTFDGLPKDKSALNDMCIDNSRKLAYLSDPGLHAIIVLDLNSGKSRIVLKDDPSTVAQPGFVLNIDGKDVVSTDGKPFVSNVNGIALTRDYRYFYFRAINQTKVYQIPTDLLANPNLADAQLSAKVEMVAETGVCHGMIADKLGNVYISDSPNHAIRYVTKDGKLRTLVQDERLIWPDSFGISGDGYLYVSASQMNRLPRYNNGEDKTEYPYRVYRIKLPR